MGAEVMGAEVMGDVSGATPKDCVLIVDDDEDIRETLSELVEMGGCSAMVASNGAEALRILLDSPPCLMILDLFMPVMTGMELLDEIKKYPTLATIPVLVSTSDPNRVPSGLPVVRKPVDIHVVWDWMRRTCRCVAATNLDLLG